MPFASGWKSKNYFFCHALRAHENTNKIGISVQSTKGNLLFLSVITLLPNNDKITNRILLRVGAIQLSTNVSSIKASLLAGNFFQVLTAVSV